MSADLAPASRRVLDPLGRLLASHAVLRVRVEGHTCDAPMWGMTVEELSRRRATAVCDHLVEVPRQECLPQGAPSEASLHHGRNRGTRHVGMDWSQAADWMLGRPYEFQSARDMHKAPSRTLWTTRLDGAFTGIQLRIRMSQRVSLKRVALG